MSRLLDEPIQVARPVHYELQQYLDQSYRNAESWVADENRLQNDDGFPGLPPREIYELGKDVLGCQTVWDAYRLLAKDTSLGGNWYDALIGIQHVQKYKLFSKILNKLEPKVVPIGLDIGAGTGVTTKLLSKRCSQAYGIDVVPEMLAVARRKVRDRGVHFLEADIMNPPFRPGSIDIVLANGVFHFLSPAENQAIIVVLSQIMKSGGRMYELETQLASHEVYNRSPRGELVARVIDAINSLTYHEQISNMAPIEIEKFGFQSQSYTIDEYPGTILNVDTKI